MINEKTGLEDRINIKEEISMRILQAHRADDAQVTPHNHYFRPCPYDLIDVYRIIDIFDVTHPCAQHALKKLIATGKRGHKSIDKDIQDMIDTLERWKAMRAEDSEK